MPKQANPKAIGVVPWVLNLVHLHGRSLEHQGVSARTGSVTVTIDELHKNGEHYDLSAVGVQASYSFSKFLPTVLLLLRSTARLSLTNN
jgi:hypothetical protein